MAKIPTLSSSSNAMRYVAWYALFLALCSVLYLVMLLYDWYASGKPNVAEMRQFISTMLGGSAVAAIGFCAKYLVDSNGDGVPDEIEKESTPVRATAYMSRAKSKD